MKNRINQLTYHDKSKLLTHCIMVTPSFVKDLNGHSSLFTGLPCKLLLNFAIISNVSFIPT